MSESPYHGLVTAIGAHAKAVAMAEYAEMEEAPERLRFRARKVVGETEKILSIELERYTKAVMEGVLRGMVKAR